ncbi:MAG: hypothetical protein JWM11_6164 [Planctomycetaceae bacterium]|nr:hypothetical protein [Planctomycetaceae bacterium]
MNEPFPIEGKPESEVSYRIDRKDQKCGESLISIRVCQGGAAETFKGTVPVAIPYQQDRAFSGITVGPLDEQNLRTACLTTAAHASDCIDGSTVSVAVLNESGTLSVANIADSPVMVFVVTGTGLVQGHYLIGDPHIAQPKIPIDWQRVPPEFRGDATLTKRFYDISISRAVGDKLYPLSSAAEICHYDVRRWLDEAGADGRVFLCVASDGICPPMKDATPVIDDGEWVQHYAKVIQKLQLIQEPVQPLTSIDIADWVINEAVARRRAQYELDNIVLQVTEIKPNRSQTMFLGICDGHRAADYAGRDLSGTCAQLTAEKLLDCLLQPTRPS